MNLARFLLIIFSIFSSYSTLAQEECKLVKLRISIKNKPQYKEISLCKKTVAQYDFLYSPNCKNGQCHLLKAIKNKNYKNKFLLGKGTFGSPQYRKCWSIDGRPEKVILEKGFLKGPATLCFSRVDSSVVNFASLYRWHLLDK